MALIYNATFDSQTRMLSLLDKAGNVISSCEVPSKELVDDPNKPLMLRAIVNGSSVKLIKNGTLSNTYQISKNGEDWTDYTFGNEFILNNEDVIYFRCRNHPTTQTESRYVKFVMTGKIEAWHNAYSMISSSFTNTGDSVGEYGMFNLFNGCTSLTKAPLLPATRLGYHCYHSMFYGCTSLTKAPQLPATTLLDSCYYTMFSGCTSLTKAPQLPAMTLAELCYVAMFSGCTSLTSAPQLPATRLHGYCYASMFYGCTSLTKAPQLPSTVSVYYCYRAMFSGCTSLTSAPQLPATNLDDNCYDSMFFGCSNLKEVRVSATRTATDSLKNWLSGVSATGDFYCYPNATIFPSGASGIPENWTRHALADYPVNP